MSHPWANACTLAPDAGERLGGAPKSLSQNRESVDDEGTCEMQQPEVVLIVLLVTDKEFPEPVMPGSGALNDPATRRVAPTAREALTAMAHMGGVMSLLHGRRDLRVVVPFVEAQMLRMLRCRSGPPDRETVQRGRRRFHVMAVGAGHHDGERSAALIGQRVALRPELAAIRRIGACLSPPSGALTVALSSDCQRHWIPRRSSYRVSSVPHSRSKTPASTHAWKRRWHVEPDPYSRGNAFHWQPVRSTYRIPSMTWRKGTTGRPGVPGGFSGGRSDSSWTQRSSGMRQIVRNRRFDRCRVVIGVDLCCDEGAITGHAEYTTFLRVLG